MDNRNWNIVTSLISGISKSINIISNDKFHQVTSSDFKYHNKIESEALSSEIFKKYKFKDYAPYVFDSIRKNFGIS